MKQKKSKHGFVLRQVVLKNVSGQMVSASVSINEMFSFFLCEHFPQFLTFDSVYVRSSSQVLFRLCSVQRYLEKNLCQFVLVDHSFKKGWNCYVMQGWRMVLQKLWVSQNFNQILRSRGLVSSTVIFVSQSHFLYKGVLDSKKPKCLGLAKKNTSLLVSQ